MGLLIGFGVYVLASVVLIVFLWWRRRQGLQKAEKGRKGIQYRDEARYHGDPLPSDEIVELNENQRVITLHELSTIPAIAEIPGSRIR